MEITRSNCAKRTRLSAAICYWISTRSNFAFCLGSQKNCKVAKAGIKSVHFAQWQFSISKHEKKCSCSLLNDFLCWQGMPIHFCPRNRRINESKIFFMFCRCRDLEFLQTSKNSGKDFSVFSAASRNEHLSLLSILWEIYVGSLITHCSWMFPWLEKVSRSFGTNCQNVCGHTEEKRNPMYWKEKFEKSAQSLWWTVLATWKPQLVSPIRSAHCNVIHFTLRRDKFPVHCTPPTC